MFPLKRRDQPARERGPHRPCVRLCGSETRFIQKLFFLEDFLGSTLGHVLGIRRDIKAAPATSVLQCFGDCRDIKQQRHPREESARGRDAPEACKGPTQCAGQEGRPWSRLPWIQIPALPSIAVCLGTIVLTSLCLGFLLCKMGTIRDSD